jgi:hypothetical protein
MVLFTKDGSSRDVLRAKPPQRLRLAKLEHLQSKQLRMAMQTRV